MPYQNHPGRATGTLLCGSFSDKEEAATAPSMSAHQEPAPLLGAVCGIEDGNLGAVCKL